MSHKTGSLEILLLPQIRRGKGGENYIVLGVLYSEAGSKRCEAT
jgi:hypothetical protein